MIIQKNYLKLLFFATFIVSCSKSAKESTTSQPEENQNTSLNSAASAENSVLTSEEVIGKQLVEGSDCSSCHQLKGAMVGPGYDEIARKYTKKDAERLADKIVNGGSGNWGAVPMSAHPAVSKENSLKMVYYILKVEKN